MNSNLWYIRPAFDGKQQFLEINQEDYQLAESVFESF